MHHLRCVKKYWLGVAFILICCCFDLHSQSAILSENTRNYAHNDSSFIRIRQALSGAKESGDSLGMAHAHLLLGQYFFDSGAFEQALNQFIDAEKIVDQMEHSILKGAVKAHLGSAHHYTGDREASLEHLNEALDIYKLLNDASGTADTYGRIGHYHEKNEDYEVALTFQQRALDLLLPQNDSLAIAKIYENFGSIYEDLMQLEKASRYFNLALSYLHNSQNYYRLANVYNNLGDTYRKSKDYEKGFNYTRKALLYAEANNSPYLIKSAMRDLSKSHSELGNYDSAFHYLSVAYLALDSIFGIEVARHTALNKVVYETEKKEAMLSLQNAEITFLEKERQHSLTLQYTFGGAFILLLIISVWLTQLQRHKMRSRRLIYEQREDIYNTRSALNEKELQHAALKEAKLKTELENKRLREIFLNDQLELRSNELTSQTLKIIRKNKVLNELKAKMEAGLNTDNKQEIAKIIDRHLRVDKNWESFQELFEKVHDDFYKKLMKKAPDLSPAEIRLCCLIKLNLPSKDIASMLGISPDSLRIARYRLRKKLQLDTKEKLGAYVMGL